MTEEPDSKLLKMIRELDKIESSMSGGRSGFEYIFSENGKAIVQYWESDNIGLRNCYSQVTIDSSGNVDFYKKPVFDNEELIPLIKSKIRLVLNIG